MNTIKLLLPLWGIKWEEYKGPTTLILEHVAS